MTSRIVTKKRSILFAQPSTASPWEPLSLHMSPCFGRVTQGTLQTIWAGRVSEGLICAQRKRVTCTKLRTSNLSAIVTVDQRSTSTILSLIHENGSTVTLEEEIQRSHEQPSRTQPEQTGHIQALLNSHLVYLRKYSYATKRQILTQ